MEAARLAALSIGGSSRAPMPATHDRACLGQTPGDCRNRGSKRRGQNDVLSFSPPGNRGLRFVNAGDIARELVGHARRIPTASNVGSRDVTWSELSTAISPKSKERPLVKTEE